MAFLTGQSWHILKTWYKRHGPGHRFWNCFTDQPRSLGSSMAQGVEELEM